MGQIVRRKKKGRPSKADLARRSGQSPATTNSDLRRSRRRRNVRYNIIDYDDYLDEEEDEDEDERRREKKKLKLVEKLNQGVDEEDDEDDEDETVAPTRGRPRVVHAHEEEVGDEVGEGDEEGEEEVEEEEEEVVEDVVERDEDEGETERGEVCEEIQN